MKNLNTYLMMTLIAMASTNQLFTSSAGAASIASAQTAVIGSNSIEGSQPMGLASEFSSSSAPTSRATSIDSGSIATPSAPTPVESATLLNNHNVTQEPMASEQPVQDTKAALPPVEQTAPTSLEAEIEQSNLATASQQVPQESAASVAPAATQESVASTTSSEEVNCAWSNMANCVKSALIAMYAAACNGVTAIKNMIW